MSNYLALRVPAGRQLQGVNAVVFKSGAGAEHRVLPRLCLPLPQHPSSQQSARSAAHQALQFTPKSTAVLYGAATFKYMLFFCSVYERIIVCPSVCLQKEKPPKLKL